MMQDNFDFPWYRNMYNQRPLIRTLKGPKIVESCHKNSRGHQSGKNTRKLTFCIFFQAWSISIGLTKERITDRYFKMSVKQWLHVWPGPYAIKVTGIRPMSPVQNRGPLEDI